VKTSSSPAGNAYPSVGAPRSRYRGLIIHHQGLHVLDVTAHYAFLVPTILVAVEADVAFASGELLYLYHRTTSPFKSHFNRSDDGCM
jgi:hypothetical protein